MLAKPCIATWGPIQGNHLIAIPVAGDQVFFYRDKVGVIAKAKFSESGPQRSNDIFHKEDEEEFSREVLDLVVLPDEFSIRPADVKAATGFQLPVKGRTPHRMNNKAVIDYLLTRFPARCQFTDQFSEMAAAEEGPRMRDTTGRAFIRDPRVRQTVLERSNGKCEWCGQVGFQTASGLVYVETHHIVPLSEGGPDALQNMVAVCPTHHREAHYGAQRVGMRQELLRRVVSSRR